MGEPKKVVIEALKGLKGTMSRDNLYTNFFIDHILLVLLDVLYGDFKFRRIFAVLFNQKRKLAGVGYTGESGLLGVA
jgi:hypothetical protein